MQRGKAPYQKLGRRLREIRRSLDESIPEVSGAVELDTDIIDSYERGDTRPSEDVLGLLISHFEIKDDDAEELYELAGYSNSESDSMNFGDIPQPPTLVMIPMENRIIYTDSANVSVNNYGVVMSFTQNSTSNQPVGVARVGMSVEHAKSVLDVLAKTIAQAETQQKPKRKKQSPGDTKS